MARYLLGNQCLVDIAKMRGLPPERWFATLEERGIDSRDVRISAVTPMFLDAVLREEEGAQALHAVALRKNCEKLIGRLLKSSEAVPVTKEVADLWGVLRGTKDLQEYRTEALLVWATAIEGLDGRPFVLVDKREAVHAHLERLGLSLEDPYEHR